MRLIALVAALTLSGTAYAQEDSVLMRRPVPNLKGGSDVPTQTPTPTPGPDTWTPAPNDPSLPDLPNDEIQYAYWIVGPWQGASSCGTQGVVTREVTCMGLAGHINAAGDAYEISHQGPVKTSICEATYGYVPDAKMEGTGAGCSYTFGLDDFGPWSNTCGYGSREGKVVCLKNGTEKVDMKYCTSNPTNGGTEQIPPYFNTEYGYNYSGCDYRWELGSPTVGECVDGFRELDYPRRYCIRYTPQGMSMGSVDNSFCGAYEKGRMACPKDPEEGMIEVQPGDIGYDSCLNGTSPFYSASTSNPPTAWPSAQAMISDVCSQGNGPCCVVNYDLNGSRNPQISVVTWYPGPAPMVQGTNRAMTCLEFAEFTNKNVGSNWIPQSCHVFNK